MLVDEFQVLLVVPAEHPVLSREVLPCVCLFAETPCESESPVSLRESDRLMEVAPEEFSDRSPRRCPFHHLHLRRRLQVARLEESGSHQV